ncbi:MAG: CbiX/SirB N-terminal domain-containing protein [Herpetosiphonaceae bacterium]|nr:CbiX/SirB N-terminal domain-containing protein [Herpetosiphonaceae bacterium]
MDAIILFSHGSVLCGAGQNLFELAMRMRERGDAPIIEVGFLNYSEPDFDTAVARCIAQGADHITIAPYFLVAGKFVTVDLPKRIEAARHHHPSVQFVVAEAMRFHPRLADALLSVAAHSREPGSWRDTDAQAAQFCRDIPQCPRYGTDACPATRARHEVAA